MANVIEYPRDAVWSPAAQPPTPIIPPADNNPSEFKRRRFEGED
jgi:hypothetical protein